MSEFHCGAHRFPAFSGLSSYINKRSTACAAGFGAIPPGAYYIVDRESGGILGSIRDKLNHRADWFSLLADDGKIDDERICDQVTRGKFRLHPKGPLGISQGCIVINNHQDFMILRGLLKGGGRQEIKGTSVLAYGKVIVT